MNKNKIINILDLRIEKNTTICVVGSNGKSTLIRRLAKFYCNKKVLVSTTTKMKLSEISDFNYFDHNTVPKNKDTFTTYKKIDFENKKVIGLEKNYFDLMKDKFDILILEGDGSKGKALKGNREFEPVIPQKTDYTIGVISFNEIGKKATKENIHNLEQFLDITNLREHDIITLEALYKVIVNKKGLFKDSQGQKILYFSFSDSDIFNEQFDKFIDKYYFEDIYILRW